MMADQREKHVTELTTLAAEQVPFLCSGMKMELFGAFPMVLGNSELLGGVCYQAD